MFQTGENINMRKLSAPIIGLQLILLGIFFLPFNSWEGISFLGEYYLSLIHI